MNSYELIVVINQVLGEAVIKEESKKIQGIITSAGAVNIKESVWGRKEIPYITNRMAKGFFVAFNFDSDRSETVSEIESALRIIEPIVNFQTHKTSIKSRKFKGNPKAKFTGDLDDDFDSDMDYLN